MPQRRFCFSSTEETSAPATWSASSTGSDHAAASWTSFTAWAAPFESASGPLHSGPSEMTTPVSVTASMAASSATTITAPTGLCPRKCRGAPRTISRSAASTSRGGRTKSVKRACLVPTTPQTRRKSTTPSSSRPRRACSGVLSSSSAVRKAPSTSTPNRRCEARTARSQTLTRFIDGSFGPRAAGHGRTVRGRG
jgi:hypothetical protein